MPAREDEIGALWIREGKTGTKFLSGKLTDGTEIVMFKNTHKQPGEKSPDYRIYKSQPRPNASAKPQTKPTTNDESDPFA